MINNTIWILVHKTTKCGGHGEGQTPVYELATDSIYGGAPFPAFLSIEAAAKYRPEIDRAGFMLMSLDVF